MARAIVVLVAAVRVAAAQDPTPLTPDVAVSDSIDALGAVDRYTLTLATSERVVLQATGAAGVLDPCVRVLTAIGSLPVVGGTSCSITARVDLTLAAGTYVVEVLDSRRTRRSVYSPGSA